MDTGNTIGSLDLSWEQPYGDRFLGGLESSRG
jgi:hypothetical protein